MEITNRAQDEMQPKHKLVGRVVIWLLKKNRSCSVGKSENYIPGRCVRCRKARDPSTLTVALEGQIYPKAL